MYLCELWLPATAQPICFGKQHKRLKLTFAHTQDGQNQRQQWKTTEIERKTAKKNNFIYDTRLLQASVSDALLVTKSCTVCECEKSLLLHSLWVIMIKSFTRIQEMLFGCCQLLPVAAEYPNPFTILRKKVYKTNHKKPTITSKWQQQQTQSFFVRLSIFFHFYCRLVLNVAINLIFNDKFVFLSLILSHIFLVDPLLKKKPHNKQ